MDADVFGLLNNTTLNMNKNLKNREKWLENSLNKIPKNQSILDAGAGELQYKKFCQHLKYTGQDFGKYNGQGNNKALQTEKWDNSKLDIISDITNIPKKDNSFDNIMCIEVLEHLPNPHKAIKEFSRLIKPNGKLIITAPFCSLTHFAPYHFITGYNKYWYQKILTHYGFEIEEMNQNGNYFDYIAQEINRIIQMGEKYSNISFAEKTLIKIINKPLILLLNKLSKKNKGSEDVLCFGIHVLAKKK